MVLWVLTLRVIKNWTYLRDSEFTGLGDEKPSGRVKCI